MTSKNAGGRGTEKDGGARDRPGDTRRKTAKPEKVGPGGKMWKTALIFV